MREQRLSGAVFRADHPEHTELSETAKASRKEPGRFNTSRSGAVYLSLEPDTAIRERQRNDGHVEHPCALFVVTLSVGRFVDLSIDEELQRWGLTRADLTSDDLSCTQRVAEAAREAGAEAILWPSATGHGSSLAVFFDRLATGSRLEIARSFDLSPKVLDAVDAGVSVMTVHPLLSTFARATTSP